MRNRRAFALVILASILLVPAIGAASAGGSVARESLAPGNAPATPRPRVPLSAAFERMLRDRLARGERLDPAIIERFGLDRAEIGVRFESAAPDAASPERGAALGPGVALGADAPVNDRSADAICANPSSGCNNRPLGQSETTIAALGDFVLAGWNNSKGLCNLTTAVQGYGWSIDGGATWVDAGDPPALPTGGRYRGDPVHAVNRTTGDFYICGLYEGGSPGSGLALARGHFAGGAFVIDDNRQIAVNGPNFLDKEWLTVDPLSGNLYVTYTNFFGGTDGQIEFMRSSDNGVTWSAPLVMNAPAALNLVQGSRPVVGPDGELYVVWYEYGWPQSHLRIRRSNDLGASFGPERTACDFYENGWSGAPGFRRGFGIALPSIAVDPSSGPRRGRVYVSWDESVRFDDAPPSSGAQSEVENNASFASATSFTVGQVLRGSFSSFGDNDQYRFSGVQGQTLYFRTDSATAGSAAQMRLICASDTSNINAYRFLANDISEFTALAFTLPATGAYYLRMTPVSTGAGSPLQTYRILTSWDTPSAGERAVDHRDQFVAWSDDGATWSTPLRVSDSDPWFDGEFPEITVDGTGAAHVFWHDFRGDATCGAESHEYLVSSADGGLTWGPNRRLSDARSFWSINVCGSANHGDYQGFTSDGGTIFPAWADSRMGDPDVWSESVRFGMGVECSPPVSPTGPDTTIAFTILNPGNVEGDYHYVLRQIGGPIVDSGDVSIAAGGSLPVERTVPSSGACDVLIPYAVTVTDRNLPGRADSCFTSVGSACNTAAPETPPAALFFAAPRPNPTARGAVLHFGLSRSGPVKLEIFAASGARVRTLASGTRAAGDHRIAWDGRDARGARLRAGVYYAALDAEGRRLRQPLVVLP